MDRKFKKENGDRKLQLAKREMTLNRTNCKNSKTTKGHITAACLDTAPAFDLHFPAYL